jgi:hypothetical protein
MVSIVDPTVGWNLSKIWMTTSGNVFKTFNGSGAVYGGNLQCDERLMFGEWHHFVLTNESDSSTDGVVKAYVDGVLAPPGSAGGKQWVGVTPLFVQSAKNGPSNYSKGRVAEISIWNTVLTDAEILSLSEAGISSVRKPVDLTTLDGSAPGIPNYAANCVHYWKMGNDLTDQTGSGNNMTHINGASSVADYPW